MKQILFVLIILSLIKTSAKGQKKELDIKPDTATNTAIQKALFTKGKTIKKEFIQVEDVKALRFQILVVTDLNTNRKTKGLYLDNQNVGVWVGRNPYARFAYLDENEIDALIEFLDNCDKRWKNDKPTSHTEYVYLTNDNLKITFWSEGGNKWSYSVEFTNFLYQNSVEVSKKLSDDLVEALKKIRLQMATL